MIYDRKTIKESMESIIRDIVAETIQEMDPSADVWIGCSPVDNSDKPIVTYGDETKNQHGEHGSKISKRSGW